LEYNCQVCPLSKLMFNQNGFVDSMCDSCGTDDCTNPIEIRSVSILGIIEKHRVYVRYSEPYCVVQCVDGYSKKVVDEEIDEETGEDE
jgi:hypothetical protein